MILSFFFLFFSFLFMGIFVFNSFGEFFKEILGMCYFNFFLDLFNMVFGDICNNEGLIGSFSVKVMLVKGCGKLGFVANWIIMESKVFLWRCMSRIFKGNGVNLGSKLYLMIGMGLFEGVVRTWNISFLSLLMREFCMMNFLIEVVFLMRNENFVFLLFEVLGGKVFKYMIFIIFIFVNSDFLNFVLICFMMYISGFFILVLVIKFLSGVFLLVVLVMVIFVLLGSVCKSFKLSSFFVFLIFLGFMNLDGFNFLF